MANLWGNGKKSNTNKANGYKNGQNLKKKGEKTVPVLDRAFNQPEAVVELPVAEIQRPAVLPHTVADHEATAVDTSTLVLLLIIPSLGFNHNQVLSLNCQSPTSLVPSLFKVKGWSFKHSKQIPFSAF